MSTGISNTWSNGRVSFVLIRASSRDVLGGILFTDAVLMDMAGYGIGHCEWKSPDEFRSELLLPDFERQA